MSICFYFIDESSKLYSNMYKDTINEQNDGDEIVLEPDLTSNNSNDPFFLDISKLKRKFN